MAGACAGHPDRGTALGGMQTVSVHPGETVYQVAQRVGVPVRDMIDANHLSPPYYLAAGQTLVVPVPHIYVVQKGDWLSTIANRFNVSQNSIARLNQLSPPYKLQVGQQLQLPNFHGEDVDTGTLNAAGAASASEGVPPPPPREAVETAPLGPPSAMAKPGMTDRSSPAALAPPTTVAALPMEEAALPASGFMWPVRGEVVSTFGAKPGGLHNDGINIAAAEGTPVHSAAAGTVAYAGNDLKGFGNLILIRHADGWVTAYAHLASMNVAKGATVKAGQTIGAVGQTGSVDSPQLHFELRHGKDAVDPTTKLST